MELTLSQTSREKIISLIGQEPGCFLRLSIQGGGCAGFSYTFLVDRVINEDDDLIFEENGAKFVIDTVSHDLVKGSEIDYTDDLMWSGFIVKNPNATSKCGCGTSFSI
jgi:iron-sulfur cluster insertion protein